MLFGYEVGIRVFEKILKKNKKKIIVQNEYFHIWHKLSDMYYKLGKYKKSIKAYKNVYILNQGIPYAIQQIIECYKKLNKPVNLRKLKKNLTHNIYKVWYIKNFQLFGLSWVR